jgi:hypothetical protein
MAAVATLFTSLCSYLLMKVNAACLVEKQ